MEIHVAASFPYILELKSLLLSVDTNKDLAEFFKGARYFFFKLAIFRKVLLFQTLGKFA